MGMVARTGPDAHPLHALEPAMWKLQLFSLLFALYLIWRFVLPLQLRPRYKALACLLLALVGARFTLFQLLGGSLLSPDFPHALLLLISYLASTMMLLGALVLAEICCFCSPTCYDSLDSPYPGIAPAHWPCCY